MKRLGYAVVRWKALQADKHKVLLPCSIISVTDNFNFIQHELNYGIRFISIHKRLKDAQENADYLNKWGSR